MTSPLSRMGPFVNPSMLLPSTFEGMAYTIRESHYEIANAINVREIGLYPNGLEINTGNQWYGATPRESRQIFRKVIVIGAVPAAGPTTVAHNIADATFFTSISATGITAVPTYLPIPYVSATLITDQIQLQVTATDVVVTSGATATALTDCVVVLEYVKT